MDIPTALLIASLIVCGAAILALWVYMRRERALYNAPRPNQDLRHVLTQSPAPLRTQVLLTLAACASVMAAYSLVDDTPDPTLAARQRVAVAEWAGCPTARPGDSAIVVLTLHTSADLHTGAGRQVTCLRVADRPARLQTKPVGKPLLAGN